MKSISLKNSIRSLLLIIPFVALGQNIQLSQNAKASVITCDTGNESYSLFGHTAIRIVDFPNNLDVVYNYGAFDFRTPNFVMKFAKGDLQYFAVANSFSDFINQYTYEQRSVFEQELDISLQYKQKLFDNLTAVLSSNESYYTYKFIDKNCTTMVVDLLNKTLDSEVITLKKKDSAQSYRSILFPYFDNFFYEKLGTSIIFGVKVDQESNHIFLPFELHKSVQQTYFKKKLLCKDSTTLLEFEKQVPYSWWNNCYSYIVLLVFILILNRKNLHLLYLFIIGLIGVFFTIMGFYSQHEELSHNYNILLFNPSLLLLLFFIFKNNVHWIINVAVLNIATIAIYFIVMLNKAHFIIVAPLIVTSTILLVKIVIQNSKRIPIIV